MQIHVYLHVLLHILRSCKIFCITNYTNEVLEIILYLQMDICLLRFLKVKALKDLWKQALKIFSIIKNSIKMLFQSQIVRES